MVATSHFSLSTFFKFGAKIFCTVYSSFDKFVGQNIPLIFILFSEDVSPKTTVMGSTFERKASFPPLLQLIGSILPYRPKSNCVLARRCLTEMLYTIFCLHC